MATLEQVTSIPERWRLVLAEHGIADARAFAQADAEDVEGWLADAAVEDPETHELERWPKAYQVRWMQAEALTLAEAEQPSEPKWYTAVHDLSVEAVLPNYEVKSGQPVNLFFRSDEQLQRLIAAGVIAPIGAGVHVLAAEPWLPEAARKQLALGGVYSVEAMVHGEAVFGSERMKPEQWLAQVEPDAGTVAGWMATARERLIPAVEPLADHVAGGQLVAPPFSDAAAEPAPDSRARRRKQ